jgi:uncharacterized protein
VPRCTVGRVFVVQLSFDDDPRRLEARPRHREMLTRLHESGVLVMAGPWADDSGALLVFRTDEAGVRKIMDEDPYYRAPGVTVASLREWRPIVGGD